MASYQQKWSELHGNVQPSRIVSAWLSIAEKLAKPLVAINMSPNLISLAGLALALSAFLLSPHWLAAVLIVLSLIFDGLDGAVAVISNRVTAWGGVLDSTADRIGEAFWALALVAAGADLRLVLMAWTLSLIQEYARARGLSLLPDARIKASLAERPVRALLIAVGLMLAPHLGTYTLWAGVWAGFQLVGLFQVWVFNRNLLR